MMVPGEEVAFDLRPLRETDWEPEARVDRRREVGLRLFEVDAEAAI